MISLTANADGEVTENSASAPNEVPEIVVTTEDKTDWSEYEGAINESSNNTSIDPVDPYEGFNRGIYRFNDTVDSIFIEPVAKGYRAVVPQWGRERVRNVVSNISSPVTLLNDVLQGDVSEAFATFWRFAINTTIGIGGMFDVAKQAGIETRKEDFGQTLGYYGMDSGPYIVLPIIGPSSGRDTVGKVVDTFSNPINYMGAPVSAGVATTDIISTREKYLDELDEIKRTSLDPYSSIKSAYLQYRQNKVRNSTNEEDNYFELNEGEKAASGGEKNE